MGDASHTTTPRIYVACLAAYNNGHLHGEWIDASQEEEDIFADINDVLRGSPVVDAEEWAIHDYEGFEGVRVEEYMSVATVVRLAAFVVEHGRLGGEVLAHFGGNLDEAATALEDRYLGQFESLADYAQAVTEETGAIPEGLRYYIDWQAMARDMEMGGEVFTGEIAHDEVHVFAG
jgi:antirestriction protein